jgi:hypothetical protein
MKYRYPLVIIGWKRPIEVAWLDALLASVWRRKIGIA